MIKTYFNIAEANHISVVLGGREGAGDPGVGTPPFLQREF